jgi:hypothetical protein
MSRFAVLLVTPPRRWLVFFTGADDRRRIRDLHLGVCE